MIRKHALWSVRALPKLCEQWKICQEKRKILSNIRNKMSRGEEIKVCLSEKKRERRLCRDMSKKQRKQKYRYHRKGSDVQKTDIYDARTTEVLLWTRNKLHIQPYPASGLQPCGVLYTTKCIFSLRQTIFSVFPPSMSVKAWKISFLKKQTKHLLFEWHASCLAWMCPMIAIIPHANYLPSASF